MSRLVRPRTPPGFRDVLPVEMALRNEVVERARRVYELHGYVPLDTPVLELLPTLVGTGGDEADEQIFQLETPGQQPLGMRFDLTVPFARVVAQYSPRELPLPFRRYHMGPVFRAGGPRPERERLCQFTQLDADIAGAASIAADAEIVAVTRSVLESLGLKPAPARGAGSGYVIRVNSRRLVDAFLRGLGIDSEECIHHILRVLDKKGEISSADLERELGRGRLDASGESVPGVGLDAAATAEVLDFAAVEGGTRADVAQALAGRVKAGELRKAAAEEVQELLAHLDALGVPEEAARFDPSLVRGLAYYTGTVYEATLVGAGVASVAGGGRYDGLASRFRDEPLPAVGGSIDLDRLVAALRNLGVDLGTGRAALGVFVLAAPGAADAAASAVAAELRAAGIPAELYVGEAPGDVGGQLARARARGSRVAAVIGSTGVPGQDVALADLRVGGEPGPLPVPRARLVPEVARLLASEMSS